MIHFLGYTLVICDGYSYLCRSEKSPTKSIIALFCNGSYHNNYYHFSDFKGYQHFKWLFNIGFQEDVDDIPF